MTWRKLVKYAAVRRIYCTFSVHNRLQLEQWDGRPLVTLRVIDYTGLSSLHFLNLDGAMPQNPTYQLSVLPVLTFCFQLVQVPLLLTCQRHVLAAVYHQSLHKIQITQTWCVNKLPVKYRHTSFSKELSIIELWCIFHPVAWNVFSNVN